MATIVTQYDPWREKLAAGLGVNLLSDALQRSQTANAERKKNAAYYETAKRLGLVGDEQPTAQAADPLLTPQTLPEGYNDNGWAKTMHDSYTPMTQFNLGTAGIGAQPQARTANSLPSQMDYLKAFAEVLNTPRFNSLNFNDVYTTMLKPTMEASATDYATQLAAQQRAMQQAYTDRLLKAETYDEYMRILNAYVGSGYTPEGVAPSMQKNAEHMFPHFEKQVIDAGGYSLPLAFNPKTGQYSPTLDAKGNPFIVEHTPSKDQIVKTQADYYTANLENAYKYANMERLALEHADDMAFKYGQEGSKNSLEYYKQFAENLDNEEKRLQTELDAMMERLEGADPQQKPYFQAKINRITAEQNRLKQVRTYINTELMYRSGLAQRPQEVWQGNEAVNSNVRGYANAINKYAQQFDVDPDLIAAIMQIESSGNPNAISNKGARGLMQFMPDTAANIAKKLGLKEYDLHNGDTSIKFGAALLKELKEQYGENNLDAILGAYHGGKKGANPKTRIEDTRKYITDVMNRYNALKAGRQNTPQAQQLPIIPYLGFQQPTAQTQAQPVAQSQTPLLQPGNSPILVNDKGKTLNEKQLIEIGEAFTKSPENQSVYGGKTFTDSQLRDIGIQEAIKNGFKEYKQPPQKETQKETDIEREYGLFSNPLFEFGEIGDSPNDPLTVDAISSAQPPASMSEPQFEISDMNSFTAYGDNPIWENFIPSVVDNLISEMSDNKLPDLDSLLTKNTIANPLVNNLPTRPSTDLIRENAGVFAKQPPFDTSVFGNRTKESSGTFANPLYEFTSENTYIPPEKSPTAPFEWNLTEGQRELGSKYIPLSLPNYSPQNSYQRSTANGVSGEDPLTKNSIYLFGNTLDDYLHRYYMETSGEKSLLDELNGMDTPPNGGKWSMLNGHKTWWFDRTSPYPVAPYANPNYTGEREEQEIEHVRFHR